MKSISVYDESLNSGFTQNHSLLIKFSRAGVAFTVLDAAQNTIVALECRDFCNTGNYTDEIKHTVLHGRKEQTGKDNFGKVIVLIDNPVFSLVPDELFAKEDEKKYLSLTHTFQVNEKTGIDHADIISSQNVYWLPSDVIDYAEKHFCLYDIRHFASVFLQRCLRHNKSLNAVYVQVSDKLLYVAVIREQKLVLCNAFEYHAKEDMVYYTLSVFRKFEFDIKSVPLFISGEQGNLDEFLSMVSAYVSKAQFFERPSEYEYCRGIRELPLYQGSVLFSAFLCV